MEGGLKDLIYGNTDKVVWGAFIFFTILMQVLYWLKVNVFKVVILMGTFALALAFAGNDLVNFIGVPLAGYPYVQSGQAYSRDLSESHCKFLYAFPSR